MSDDVTEPSLHQLRLFLVLAEELHFGNAARRTFMSQPSFSRQIKQLEQRLGTCLVERGTRSAELTPAGKALLAPIGAVVESMRDLRRLAEEQSRTDSGRIMIGVIGGEAGQPYMHAMLAELRRVNPGLSVDIRSLDFATQFEAVATGEVDAAVLRPPVPVGLQTLHLATEARVAVLSARDPLVASGVQSVTLAQLRDRIFVDMPARTSREWWNYWSVNPRPDGSSVRFGPIVGDIEALLVAVGRGEGIAFLPAAARHLYPRPGIAYVDVTDLPACTAALVWAAKNRSLPRVAALRAAARTVTGERQPRAGGTSTIQDCPESGNPTGRPARVC